VGLYLRYFEVFIVRIRGEFEKGGFYRVNRFKKKVRKESNSNTNTNYHKGECFLTIWF
ncbi:unnamed protein product, partial [marine sediment metagenome]